MVSLVNGLPLPVDAVGHPPEQQQRWRQQPDHGQQARDGLPPAEAERRDALAGAVEGEQRGDDQPAADQQGGGARPDGHRPAERGRSHRAAVHEQSREQADQHDDPGADSGPQAVLAQQRRQADQEQTDRDPGRRRRQDRPGSPRRHASSGVPGRRAPGSGAPASPSRIHGLRTARTVHGRSTSGGTTRTAPRRSQQPSELRLKTATAMIPTAAASRPSHGTNAVTTARSSPLIQARRREPSGPAPWPPRPMAREACQPTTGSNQEATAVPRRPPATAPVTAGRKA